MYYLFLDVETGGIGDQFSLLTAYFLLTDENFTTVSEMDFTLKPDDGIYRVCGEALGVNKINLVEHDKEAITYTEAGKQLYNWLDVMTVGGKNKHIIVGHNIAYDRDCIVRNLISRGSWDKFCSYRLRDTQTIACYLIDIGLIKDISGGLGSLVDYFHIKVDENQLHNAKYDTEKTRDVYKALVKLGREIVDAY